MKRKLFSMLLAAAMVLTLAPVAMAQEEAPYVTEFSFINNGVPHSTASGDGIITLPGTTTLSGLSFTVTFNEPVDFVVSPGLTESGGIYEPGSDVPRGAMYVSSVDGDSVSLNMNITTGTFNFNSAVYSLTLTSTDGHITWSGSAPEVGLFAVSLFDLVQNLANPVPIPAGSAESVDTGTPSKENNIIFNRDSENVYIREGGPGVTIYTVTYVCNSETYVWKVPAGSTITYPVTPEFPTLEFSGWYLNSEYTTEIPNDYTVNDSITVYAKYTDTTGKTFSEQLADQNQKVVTIESKDDFEVFANQASIVDTGRRVVLGVNLDYTGDAAADKTFEAISYKGNFDGGGHTITGATFTPNGNNAGMFATIGQGQIIANLNLDHITVEYAQNAGTLAGSTSANSGDTPTASRPLIQNVQVTNSTVSGQNAGGLVGFTFITIIKFCSVSDTTVDGLVNAGGIAAQSYSDINNCYTNGVTLSAFLYNGGIVATLLEASNVTNCWTTESNIFGRNPNEQGTVTGCFTNPTAITPQQAIAAGFSSQYWRLTTPLTSSTFTNAVYYSFAV